MVASLVAQILAALPQTQCTRCGYPDCAGYAEAIAHGAAPINQCPPGGLEGVKRLSAITGQSTAPLNPENGLEGPRAVAIIDEDWCIGCTLCIAACPVDAIFGTNKMMHTVIEPHCTGCELCLPVCPVDCIALENVTGTATGWDAWSSEKADSARARYELHSKLLNQDVGKSRFSPVDSVEIGEIAADGPSNTPAPQQTDKKRAVVEAALLRAKHKADPTRRALPRTSP
jgi:Na+-translocating ferredoxin:NAD+ oxidoreductase subunit B